MGPSCRWSGANGPKSRPGTVEAPRQIKGESVIETGDLSYFSRLTDATTFQRLALVETQRWGVDRAGAVGAVTDGSAWCQGFVDFHRPDAVRILDFPHAAEYVAAISQAAIGEGSPEAQAWLTEQLHHLKHDGPLPTNLPPPTLTRSSWHRLRPTWSSTRPNWLILLSGLRAGRLATAPSKVPTSWWSGLGSKAVACTGRAPMPTPCLPCATLPVTTARRRLGHRSP
jgi:hypothetical protein